jgi:hypothetical protein
VISSYQSYSCASKAYCEIRNIFGRLEVAESSRATRVHHALEVLRSVKSLLLLEQKDVASHGNSTDILAVCAVEL